MKNIAISVKNLHITYKGLKKTSIRASWKYMFNKREKFEALKGVSFELEEGKILGVIGKNGSGKSTLLKAIARIFSPDKGSINLHGHKVSLLSIGVGFNKKLTGRENIFLSGLLLGYTEEQIQKKVKEIIEFADIGDFIDKPVKTYSSGMYSKLAFAITAILETDITLIDEVLSVGDAKFKEKSYNKMKRLGKFDKSLIVFEEVLPNLSISNNYDNYIISGNDTNRVSLVFTIKNSSYLEEILAILNKKNVKATFFIESNMFENSTDIIKTILTYGHDVELLDNTYEISTIKKYNSIKKTIANDTFSYCYTTTKNEELLNNCKKEKMHTIIPTIITGNYPYSDIKNSLNNGAIISFENNQNTVRELSSIINYIGQKGKKITILEKLLEE